MAPEKEFGADAGADDYQLPVVEGDDFEERAAIIEYGAGVPRQWAEGYAALSTMAAPTGFSPARWQRIIDATGTFLDRWAAEAIECSWSALDVFGVNPDRPTARFDAMGLVLLLDRCSVVSIDEHGADLLTKTGAPALLQAPAAGRHGIALGIDAMSLQAEHTLQQEIAWRLKAMPMVALPIPNGLWIPARTEAERSLVARIIARA
jgi:hypothetical protein